MATADKTNRPALILLVIVAAAVCLAMGWWQWDRYESASGSAQNLGYALQWPLFAVFVVYSYRRFVKLEESEDAEPAVDRADGPTEIPADILPPRPAAPVTLDDADDPEARQLLEYNAYLAELRSTSALRDNSAQDRVTDRSTT